MYSLGLWLVVVRCMRCVQFVECCYSCVYIVTYKACKKPKRFGIVIEKDNPTPFVRVFSFCGCLVKCGGVTQFPNLSHTFVMYWIWFAFGLLWGYVLLLYV